MMYVSLNKVGWYDWYLRKSLRVTMPNAGIMSYHQKLPSTTMI